MFKKLFGKLMLFLVASGSETDTKQKAVFEAIFDNDIAALETNYKKHNLDKCYDYAGKKFTFLSYAISINSNPGFDFLIKNGAKLDKICDGKPPLHLAIEKDRKYMFDALFEKGADPSIEDSAGQNALAYAKALGKSYYIEKLQNK